MPFAKRKPKRTMYSVQVKAFNVRRLVTIAKSTDLGWARQVALDLEDIGFQVTIHWKKPKR